MENEDFLERSCKLRNCRKIGSKKFNLRTINGREIEPSNDHGFTRMNTGFTRWAGLPQPTFQRGRRMASSTTEP